MKNVDELFTFIKSLSKSEKKNFRLYISMNNISNRSNYLILFDYLNSINEYNSDAIKKYVEKYKFSKHLSVTKNYLFNLILESIYYYEHQTLPLFKLRKEIFYVKLLLTKKQYIKARKLLLKIKSEALKHEYSNIILEVFDIEKTLFKIFPDKTYNKQKELYQEKFMHLDSISTILTYEFLINEIEQYSEIKGIPLNKKSDFEEFRKKFNHRIKNLNQFDSTSKVKEFRLSALARYYTILIENDKALYYYLQLSDHLEKNSHLLINRENVYAVCLMNVIILYITINDLESCNTNFIKLREYANSLAPKIKKNHSYLYTSSVYRLELYRDKHFGLFDPESESLRELDKIISRKKILDKTTDLFNMYLMIYYYFAIGAFERTMYWYNKLMKYKHERIRLDCFQISTLIIIITYYELKQFNLFDSVLNSTFYTNEVDGEYKDYFNIIKKHLIKLAYEINEVAKIQLFIEFENELLFYFNRYPLKREILNFFDIFRYIYSKINKVGFNTLEYKKVISI